jgi:hypothetical protein
MSLVSDADLTAFITAQRTKLCDIIDIEFGLLSELLTLRVLNYQQVEIIEKGKTSHSTSRQALGLRY